MNIALAQINPTVGDISGNAGKILSIIERAKEHKARLVVFPELALVGYPPKDLLLKRQFVADNLTALQDIAAKAVGIDVLVGYVQPNESGVGRPLFNALVYCSGGKVVSRHYKSLLPTYDVFDESRYFEPAPAASPSSQNLIRIDGVTFGLSICEDLWNDERLVSRRLYHHNPIAELNAAGADVLINASASPFVVGKQKLREELFGGQVKRFGKPLVYVNQVGGNDELVFDGNSMVFDALGQVTHKAAGFEEDLLVVDVQPGMKGKAIAQEDKGDRALEEIFGALVLGLGDYMRKTGFKSAVLGLSGGIDSALVAALAVAAVGPGAVTGVAMPSRYSSEHSLADARALARALGMTYVELPISAMHDAYERQLDGVFGKLAETTKPAQHDLAEQNIQARIRGAALMAVSNKFDHLLLTTGNKSEIATGYCTLYGDMCGGLAVISDVPKTTVWALARWINTLPAAVRRSKLPVIEQAKQEALIPVSSIEKPPSAELKPGQVDQDSLPPYEVLDAILEMYIEEEASLAEMVGAGHDEALVRRVIRMVERSEYKRRQAAPGLKVTSRAFGFGRRMPIAQRYEPYVKPGQR